MLQSYIIQTPTLQFFGYEISKTGHQDVATVV